MVRRLVPLIFTLCAFTLHAESTRFGSLGRNDSVVTKESDPIASAAIASETSARQFAVTDLTDKINAESAARTQAFLSVEAQLEALNAKKQDAVVTFLSVDNTGVNVGDSNATGALDNMSDISWIKGPLADFGLGDKTIEPFTITLFRRSGSTTNQNASRILRLLRWNGSAWYVAYQAVSPVVHNDVTINGGRIEHQMEYIAGSARIPADEAIVLCYAPAKSSPVTAVLNFGAKVMATTDTRYLATGQSAIPASPSTAAGWPQLLAMELTVTEYKDALSTVSARVDGVAAQVDATTAAIASVQSVADAASETALAAKTASDTASLAADGAHVIAQSAVSAAQTARTTAEAALTKASAVEKTANAAATASSVSALTERVADLEANTTATPSSVAALQQRVETVETAVATASETAETASEAAETARTTAESAKATAQTALATAESAKTTASTVSATAFAAQSAAEKAQSDAQSASATAQNALAKASTVEKTANAAATATTVAALTDRVTVLENRPAGGVADADLAAETSARKAADADLSARIESVASNAAGRATVTALQSQVSALQADVISNSAAIASVEKTAASAVASAATAQSKANIASADAASAVSRAVAAETMATNAHATVSSIGEQIADIHAIAEEVQTTAVNVSALAQQAAIDAENAAKASASVTNDVKVLYERDTLLDNAIAERAKTQWFSFHNNYSHLGFPGTSNSASELMINDYGMTGAYTTVRIGKGLKHITDTSSGSVKRHIEVDLDALGINDSSWVHKKDWQLTAYPAEKMVTVKNASGEVENEIGQIMSTATVTRTESLSRGLQTAYVDPTSSGVKTIASWSAPEAVTVVPTYDGAAIVSTSVPGLYNVTATDSAGVVRELFVPFVEAVTTEQSSSVYAADVEGSYRKMANDAILSYLQARETNAKESAGITKEVASDDRVFYWNGNYQNYSYTSGSLPRKYVLFANVADTWGPPAVPVAPHYAITAAHWNPGVDRIFNYFPRLSGTDRWSMAGSEGVALADWARQNGYSEEEIAAANISDIFVYRMDGNGSSSPQAFPNDNIPYVLDQSALDYYYNGSLEGIACYTITQDRLVSYAMYNRARGESWCGFGVEYDPQFTRSDIRDLLTPSYCTKIYGGDSGRPILFLHEGEKPVLTSIFWTAEYGSSLVGGCDILNAYIQQHSGGTESLRIISAPTE